MNQYFENNENLKSELRTLNYCYKDYNFSFQSDNGVFSKDKIDYGSKLLIETVLANVKSAKHILDVGCGYGFMGIVLSRIFNAKTDMVDVNKRCLHLTEMNIKENEVNCNVFESNAYENIKEKYDLIITNPPIRAGKKVVLDILINSKKHLTKDGCVWFVIRKDQGAKSIVNLLKNEFEVKNVIKNKGFSVFSLKNIDNLQVDC